MIRLPRFSVVVVIAAGLLLTLSPVAWSQAPLVTADQLARKKALITIYKAYASYEVSKGKPAKKVEDLEIVTEDVKMLKKMFNFDELGHSVTQDKKEDLAKVLMVYEIEASKNGGMVMFYDGSIKAVTAKEMQKLLGK